MFQAALAATQDPYFQLLDANGDGILTASEVFAFAPWLFTVSLVIGTRGMRSPWYA